MRNKRERTGSVRGERHDRQEDEAKPLVGDVPRIAHIFDALDEHLHRVSHDANGEELPHMSGSLVATRAKNTTHDKDDRHPYVHLWCLRRKVVLLVLELLRCVRVAAVHFVLAWRVLDVHTRCDVTARARISQYARRRSETSGVHDKQDDRETPRHRQKVAARGITKQPSRAQLRTPAVERGEERGWEEQREDAACAAGCQRETFTRMESVRTR
jgi:hypothetical protein